MGNHNNALRSTKWLIFFLSSLLPALKNAYTNWSRPSISAAKVKYKRIRNRFCRTTAEHTDESSGFYSVWNRSLNNQTIDTDWNFLYQKRVCLPVFGAYECHRKKKLATKRHFASQSTVHAFTTVVCFYFFFAGFSWKTRFCFDFPLRPCLLARRFFVCRRCCKRDFCYCCCTIIH